MGIDETRRLAEQALELKDHPAFTAAILALRKLWFAELMSARDREMIEGQVIRLQALEAIPQQLQIFINDYEAAKRRQR